MQETKTPIDSYKSVLRFGPNKLKDHNMIFKAYYLQAEVVLMKQD